MAGRPQARVRREFGRAILVRDDLAEGGKSFDRQLPVDRQRDLAKRPIICLAMARIHTLFCSTHLTSGGTEERDQERAAQVEKMHKTFKPYIADEWNVVFGADMNMRPADDNLDSVYDPSYGQGAHGIYLEAHPDRLTSAPTHESGNAIDYVFVSDPLSISTPTITDVPYSDHHVYETTILVSTRS
ncbi:MAG: hypothetical protein GEU93_04435 [Propionibacteriales bacterium]|nr:hypothetical protein [Propionibacteriales bacterium]